MFDRWQHLSQVSSWYFKAANFGKISAVSIIVLFALIPSLFVYFSVFIFLRVNLEETPSICACKILRKRYHWCQKVCLFFNKPVGDKNFFLVAELAPLVLNFRENKRNNKNQSINHLLRRQLPVITGAVQVT